MMHRGPGGMMRGGAQMPPPQTGMKDFRGTVRLLAVRLRPELHWIILAVLLTSASVALLVLGPKLLGNATNIIFNGVVGKGLPAGLTKDQAIAFLQSRGQSQLASMLSGMNVVPGAGV